MNDLSKAPNVVEKEKLVIEASPLSESSSEAPPNVASFLNGEEGADEEPSLQYKNACKLEETNVIEQGLNVSCLDTSYNGKESTSRIHGNKISEIGSKKKPVLGAIIYVINTAKCFASHHKKTICLVFRVFLVVGITGYMIAAMVRNLHRALPLFVVWCLVFTYRVYLLLNACYGEKAACSFMAFFKKIDKNRRWIKLVFIACIVIGFIIWIAIDTVKRPHQFISVVGYFVFLFGLFVTSKYPDKVIWRPVLLGLLIQVFCGMFVLRTPVGFNAFNWLGTLAQTFINYVNSAVVFLFGENFFDHYIAFKVLPIVIYFGSFISILYFLGAIQWLILKIAWLMQFSLKTSATESMVAAGNIFVGLAESPLLIRPYIHDLTTSELHAVMTAGFGSIAGSVLGAYLGFGIQPVYVITACVMAAPCALAVSKLVYPETTKSKFATSDGLIIEKTVHRNVIEAAFVGASQAIPLVTNIAGNVIAFLSLLAAVNGFLGWFGGLLDYPELSFEVISSYVFMPITLLMGVDWEDCFKAAELLGKKIFLNEFIAYEALGEMIKIRDNGSTPHIDPITGAANWIGERSEAIITYALCGFANIGSVGIILGALGTMAPDRQSELVKIVMSGLISGAFVSILNACIAGFLYVPRPIVCDNMLSATNWTYTDPSRLFECCSTAMLFALPNATEVQSCCAYNWNSTNLWLNCSTLP